MYNRPLSQDNKSCRALVVNLNVCPSSFDKKPAKDTHVPFNFNSPCNVYYILWTFQYKRNYLLYKLVLPFIFTKKKRSPEVKFYSIAEID